MFISFELAPLQLIVLVGCAFLVGFSKTAGTTLSSIIIPVMVDVFPAKEATGILALTFFIASFHAVYHYRKHVKWQYFIKLMPSAMAGFGLGALFMSYANNDHIKLIIGLIILGMLGLNICTRRTISLLKKERKNTILSILCGMLIGFSSIVANAGSPIMAVFLLIQREKKTEIIGTLAMFFFFTDLIKIPINIWTGVITLESLKLNGLMLPLMVLGGFAGIAFIKHISENRFRRFLEILTFCGSLKLIYRPLVDLI